jgi:hypothetical protein
MRSDAYFIHTRFRANNPRNLSSHVNFFWHHCFNGWRGWRERADPIRLADTAAPARPYDQCKL